MVIPGWSFPRPTCSSVCRRRRPHVAFTTLRRPGEMPEQNHAPCWTGPTARARIDEAMHPLAFLAVGVYDRELPNRTAPLRRCCRGVRL